MNYDSYALYAVIGLMLFIFGVQLYSKGLRPIAVHLRGYRWYEGAVTHLDTIALIEKQRKLIADKNRAIQWLQTNKIRREKTGQLRFELDGTRRNGHRAVYNYPIKDPKTGKTEDWRMVFKNTADRIFFQDTENKMWVGRMTRGAGKRRDRQWKPMWIDRDDFNPTTDDDILATWPYMPDGKTLIPDKYLPFRMEKAK